MHPVPVPGVTERGRGALLSLLLVAGSLGLCLIALEVAVRVWLHDEVDTEALRQRREESSLRALVEPSPDPELLFELRPGLRTRFGGAAVAIGPERCRVSTALPPAAGEIRVAVLGDSTSFGWGVGYEQSYPERFRRRLEAMTGRAVELRNYSVPGYNARQELRAFETRVVPWRPHLVIVHHDHNDAEPAVKTVGTDFMPAEYGDNPLHSALVKWSARRLRRMRNEAARAAATGGRLVGGYIAAGPPYEAQLEARRALRERAGTLGVPVVIVLFNAVVVQSDGWERDEAYTALHRDLATRLDAMGYHVLDLYPHYQTAFRQRGWTDSRAWWRSVSPRDAHPNAEGHRFIAERLAERVLGDPALVGVFAAPAARTAGAPVR